jgi:hypothetical protein
MRAQGFHTAEQAVHGAHHLHATVNERLSAFAGHGARPLLRARLKQRGGSTEHTHSLLGRQPSITAGEQLSRSRN